MSKPEQPQQTLTLKAAALLRVAPEEWAAFVDALAVYVEVHRNNVIHSPLPELPVNQGRAQALSSLLTTLKDCRANAEKVGFKP